MSKKVPAGEFKDKKTIYKVDFGKECTEIGDNAFNGCENLNEINNDSNVITKIGQYAFASTKISNVKFNKVNTIGNYAFEECKSLSNITINSDCSSIGKSAFKDCTSLLYIDLPNKNYNCILNDTFKGCSGLTIIKIPSSVESIGDGAFEGCTGLNRLRIENGVKELSLGYNSSTNKGLFCDCQLRFLYLDRNLSYNTDYSPFYNIKTLKSVTIGNSVTSIGSSAFGGCTGLTSIEIPNSVTTIGKRAFSECTSLTSIEIPNSVTTIGDYAFYDCSKLENITIPDGVTTIGKWAFSNCTGLTSIEIPNSVTTIEDYAFYRCKKLTSIEIPNSVTTIEDYTFEGCTGLTSITIGNSVTTIGDKAFYNCKNLTSITSLITADKLFIPAADAFYNVPTSCTLYVPRGAKETYATTEGWNKFTNIVESAYDFEVDGIFYNILSKENKTVEVTYKGSYRDEYSGEYSGNVVIPANVTYEGTTYSVTTIGDEAFRGCEGLTSITIPNSVTTIGDSAFRGCEGLTSITIPNSVTYIEELAFHYCIGLTSIEIPNSVTTIGKNAFRNCDGLTSIVVAENNTIYDSREDCNAIIETATNTLIQGCKNTVIPNSVTTIGDYALYSCDGLTSIEIPNSVTTIGESAFENCIKLETVKINENESRGLTSINNYAFKGCTDLTTLNLPNGLKSIGVSAFEDCIKYAILPSLTTINLDLNLNVNDNTLPTSLETISEACFKSTGIEKLIITENNNNLINIPKSAFENCKNLNILDISRSNIRTIDDNAFNSNILSVTLPSTLEYLGNKSLYTVSKINVVINNGNDLIANPPKFKDSNSRPFNDDSKIYITKGYIDTYEEDDYWGMYKTNIYDHGYINDYIKDCYITQESDGSNKLYITFNEFAPNEWENVKVIFNTYGNNNDIDYNKFITIKSDTLNYVLETNLDYPSNNNGQISTEVGYLKIIGIENSYIPFINDKKHTIKLDLQIQ